MKKHTGQWYRKRVGRTIYRKKLKCPCPECQKTSVYIWDGITAGKRVASKYFHADYLYDCSQEMGIQYYDKPVEK